MAGRSSETAGPARKLATGGVPQPCGRSRPSMWCIPREQDPAFVAAMEQVLTVYQRPYDPLFPVVNTQRATDRHQLAVHDRQGQNQTQTALPENWAALDYQGERAPAGYESRRKNLSADVSAATIPKSGRAATINLGCAATIMIAATPRTASPGGSQRAGRRRDSHANQIAPKTSPMRTREAIKKSLVEAEPENSSNAPVNFANAAASQQASATSPARDRRLRLGGTEPAEPVRPF